MDCQELLVRYKTAVKTEKSANIELEIRMQDVQYKIFMIYYNYMLKNAGSEGMSEITTVKTINGISDDYIKEKTFTDTGKSERFVEKTRLITKRVNNCLIVVSREKVYTHDVILQSNAIIRIKLRKSVDIVMGEHTWRLDLTIVHQVNAVESENLKRYLTELHSIEDFRLATNPLYKYEVEMEYISGKDLNVNLEYAITKFMQIMNPDIEEDNNLNRELRYVNSLISPSNDKLAAMSIKKILPSVVAITKTSYKELHPQLAGNYLMTDKAEGIRSLAIIKEGKCYIANSALTEIATVISEHDTYIIDGEYIADQKLFLAFDVIMYKNQHTYKTEGVLNRVKVLLECGVIFNKYLNFKPKTYYEITDNKSIQENYEKCMQKGKYAKDGIIFTSATGSYNSTETYKWKGPEHNTIDFLVKKAPSAILGKKPFISREDHTMYLLFVGISEQMYRKLGLRICPFYSEIFGDRNYYFPMQFAPSSHPYAFIMYHKGSQDLDGKIVEMRATSIGKYVDWKVINIRTDRDIDLLNGQYYGNDYRIAELTWINYIDPFLPEELWNPAHSYFHEKRSGIYDAPIKFVSWMKKQTILDMLTNMKTVIDIGSGQGQDMHKCAEARIQNLVAVDKDKVALSELMTRRLERENRTQHSMAINTIHADLNEPGAYDTLITDLRENFNIECADAVMCNLAIHYFVDSIEKMENYVKFCSKILRKAGIVIITCFFGDLIHKLFTDNKITNGESFKIYQDGVTKFELKRLYDDHILSVGQKIGVLLPFSSGELYVENLVNFNIFTSIFLQSGFKLIECSSFEKYIDNYTIRNNGSGMTEDDKKYNSLFGKIVLTKV